MLAWMQSNKCMPAKEETIGSGASQLNTELVMAQIHPTHSTETKNGVTWCNHCGHYCVSKALKLQEPCPGKPKNATTKKQLARVAKGLHPNPKLQRTMDAQKTDTRHESIELGTKVVAQKSTAKKGAQNRAVTTQAAPVSRLEALRQRIRRKQLGEDYVETPTNLGDSTSQREIDLAQLDDVDDEDPFGHQSRGIDDGIDARVQLNGLDNETG